jgi:hypothetical protein
MKKIFFFTFPLICLSIISCTRDSNESKPANTSLSLESFKKFNTTAEGYVFITLDEYFDQPVTLTSATFSAEFMKKGQLTNVGSVQVNGNLLKKSTENHYLLNNGIKANELLNNSINVKVNSKNNDFPDISSDIQTTSNLEVKTNIGLEGTFNKNQDLVLKWTPANKSNDVSLRSEGTVYLGIAATGSAVISREVPDNGQTTISASELANLSPNSQAVIRLGRVTQKCTTQNGITVCVDVLNSASSGPLVIQ